MSDATEKDIYTVSRLNRAVHRLLDQHFPVLWVEGEISNLATPASGHIYFSLKDASAQIRCAMFRNRNRGLQIKPANGDQVLVRAKISVYEPRGDYQLIVEHMEPAGEGALRQAFEALKRKLDQEGLFATELKQPLPTFPHCIGIVTSPTGAAIRDILSVLRRRCPMLPVVIYPSAVQGEDAPTELVKAIQLANSRAECDVLLLARGGGSLEDLWAFNDERLARAISASQIPVVSGVGHEIDFTIADFVADLRAPTPSVAAESVAPDQTELAARLTQLQRRLHHLFSSRLQRTQQQVDWLQGRLLQQHPQTRLQQYQLRVDELAQRITHGMQQRLRHWRHVLSTQAAQLLQHNPKHQLLQTQNRLRVTGDRLRQAMQRMLEQKSHALKAQAVALHAISPLATMERGYAILKDAEQQVIIRSVQQVAPADKLVAYVSDGTINATVESCKTKTDK